MHFLFYALAAGEFAKDIVRIEDVLLIQHVIKSQRINTYIVGEPMQHKIKLALWHNLNLRKTGDKCS